MAVPFIYLISLLIIKLLSVLWKSLENENIYDKHIKNTAPYTQRAAVGFV